MKIIFTFLLLLISFPAAAEVYNWIDPKYRIKLTYPDDWMHQAKEGDYVRLHILAPQGQDHAACRVFAHNDNRFLYVPPQGAQQVTQFIQDEQALKGIFANILHYDNVFLSGYQDIASLGKGPATMAMASFTKDWNGKTYPMTGIVFGGYVHGLKTIFQCESTAAGWERWQPIFMNMVSTFDFPTRSTPLKQGYYRDFMADGYVYFPIGDHRGRAMY